MQVARMIASRSRLIKTRSQLIHCPGLIVLSGGLYSQTVAQEPGSWYTLGQAVCRTLVDLSAI